MRAIRTLTITALATAALALTACTADPATPAAAATTTATTTTTAAPAPTKKTTPAPTKTTPRTTTTAPTQDIRRQAFLATLDEEGIYYSTPASAVTVGNTICKNLDQGTSIARIMATMASTPTDANYTTNDIGFIIGASIAAFCPQHIDKVQ